MDSEDNLLPRVQESGEHTVAPDEGVQEMLRKYQEKYRKQKEESLRHASPLLVARVPTTPEPEEEAYINRSFVSGAQKATPTQPSQPFEFVESNSTSVVRETTGKGLSEEGLLETTKRLEKQLLRQQVQFDGEQRVRDAHYARELRARQEEVAALQEKLMRQQEKYEAKMEALRDRLKCVEKTVYERVEGEYSRILL